MGAFGLNASIMDSANVAWKVGLCARNFAQLSTLGPTFDQERRLHANSIIRVSGSYLRFVCNSEFPLASFDVATADLANLPDAVPYTPGKDLEFIREFFSKNSHFLLGVDAPYPPSVISPRVRPGPPAISPRNGVRAPNPRLCFTPSNTGYLYDALLGAGTIHLVIFASDLQGPVAEALAKLSTIFSSPDSFYHVYGGRNRFNTVLVTKCLEYEAESLISSSSFAGLKENCRILYDDRAPDEDAHSCYEVDHVRGAIVVVRPDLWVGESAFLDESEEILEKYFRGWLIPVSKGALVPHYGGQVNGYQNGTRSPIRN
jgi:phenol 2-monooxygenase (NADPH)